MALRNCQITRGYGDTRSSSLITVSYLISQVLTRFYPFDKVVSNEWDDYDLSPWPMDPHDRFKEPSDVLTTDPQTLRTSRDSKDIYPGRPFPAPKAAGFSGDHKRDYESSIREHFLHDAVTSDEHLISGIDLPHLHWRKRCLEINTEKHERDIWEKHRGDLTKREGTKDRLHGKVAFVAIHHKKDESNTDGPSARPDDSDLRSGKKLDSVWR
jgi:hypothetical protein